MSTMQTSEQIISLFRANVVGKKAPKVEGEADGAQGHWLEKQFGLTPNGRNEPDIDGFELKKDSSRISFGDWSADYYIFKNEQHRLDRDGFLSIFGTFTPQKNRFSWSGSVVPKYGLWNEFGQTLYIDERNNVYALYNWRMDLRPDKERIVPQEFRNGNLVLACWKATSLALKVEEKFNRKGWFICLKDESGAFVELGFGEPIAFTSFIEFVKSGEVFFDSGMYEGNERPYSQWRANKTFWYARIVVRLK
jgi:hypothetical protein